jgi:hypothetical protein
MGDPEEVLSPACIACGGGLSGPFQPKIRLTHPAAREEPLRVTAYAWICVRCGLVHWYAQEEDRERLRAEEQAAQSLDATPGEGYERRTQMQRMLQKVRRM